MIFIQKVVLCKMFCLFFLNVEFIRQVSNLKYGGRKTLLGLEFHSCLIKLLLSGLKAEQNWFESYVVHLAERINVSDELVWRILTKLACNRIQEVYITESSDQKRVQNFENEIKRNDFGDILKEAKKRNRRLLNGQKWGKLCQLTNQF